jgi:diguanylate cyclase (GGDEF)-like protein
MSIWSFAFSIAVSAPDAESSVFWLSISVFGRGVFFSLLLHFILILTKPKNFSKIKWVITPLIYVPAVINVILFGPNGVFAKEIYQMVPSKLGWIHIMPMGWINIALTSYYLIYTLISVFLVVRWWRKLEPDTILKKQATYFLVAVLVSLVAGFTLDILPDIIGKALIPKISILILVAPIILLFYSLKAWGLLLEKKKTTVSYPKSDFDTKRDRLRLFHVSAVLFMVGGLASFMIGYFGMRKPIEGELLLASIVFATGLFLLFLPLITKNHAIQNVIFLIICSLGVLMFMLENVETGAITVWSVYIIFLSMTVVLDSRRHAIIFTTLCIMIEIVFSIFIPEVVVTVDRNDYVTRIIIILLSYFTVKFLTNEYDSKMKGYQKFAKEQEMLERISTNFISIDSENVGGKISEMFEASAEVLDFDQGYLIEFSNNYEDATILNAYNRDGVVETNGMIVNSVFFSMVQTFVTKQQPMGCTDTTSISIHEEKEEREFFISRGILSYYALPVIIENQVISMLVVENRQKINSRVWEHQINFWGLIANMLADAKKKILYEEQLYNYAYFDEVTKLANNNMLIRKLEANITNRKESEKLAVLHIELENLRMINDTFGHKIGDKIVIQSASILKNILGDCCCLARVEQEAFMIVISNLESDEQIQNYINQIIKAFSVPILPTEGRQTLFVTTAIGVALYPDDGKDVNTLLQNADLAGYEAKHSENKVVFCSDQLTNRITENIELTNRLFTALDNEEFSLEFQPLISSKTEKTAGVEALLRWNYDVDKRIRPDIFIPILEKTGLIHDVGLWVLEQALKEHKRLVSKGFPPLRFSINISIIQFRKDDFVAETIKIIKESKVNPKYIELEITESFLAINFEDTIEKLSKLKEFGVSIAIDDFGKGYSSLHRLEIVPFDRIKIDKSIVDDIISEKKKTVIVQTIVSLARALMANITAEGVETKEQLDFLVEMDCDEIQGYYYSKPLPIDTLEKFLENENT